MISSSRVATSPEVNFKALSLPLVSPVALVAKTVPLANVGVYVVDDCDLVRSSMQALLGVVTGVPSVGFASGEALLADADHLQPGCVLLDHHLAGMDGLAVLAEIGRRRLPLAVILAGGDVDATVAGSAKALGAVAALSKPFSRSALADALSLACRRLESSHVANAG